MKKFALFLAPLLAVSCLTNCGSQSGPKLYTVTFDSNGGSSVAPQTVIENKCVIEPKDPIRAEGDDVFYTFKEWQLEGKKFDFTTQINSDITLKAEWNVINKLTVTFNLNGGKWDDGSTDSKIVTVKEGEKVARPDKDPTREYPDDTHGYVFNEWQLNGKKFKFSTLITKSITLKADWVIVNKHTVTFNSNGGSEVPSQIVIENKCAVKPTNPSKDTAEATYTFVCWELDNKEFNFETTPITEDITLIAKWNKGPIKKYTITWKMDDGSTLRTDQVEYDKMPDYGEAPKKDSTAQYDYTFTGWNPSITKVTSNATYVATFSSTIRSYDVIFQNGDKILQNEHLEYGTTPKYKGDIPTKPQDAQYTYAFSNWYPAITPVAGVQTYTAQFNKTPNEYTVAVTSEDTSKGMVDGGGIYAYGSSVTIKAIPSADYAFVGWYEGKTYISNEATYSFEMPANNVSYVAKFYAIAGPWYKRDKWWEYCSNGVVGEQAAEEDIGKEVDLTVNNQIHKVRLIDVEHDELSDDSGKKAHCTFEFSNLLSDSSGYSLATFWNTSEKDSSTNYDYLNSDLRKALDGQGNGTLRWYQKDSPTKSTTYTTSVYDMLPSSLKDNIKTVKKHVATTSSYDVTDYGAKVFALTHNEMTKSSGSEVKAEGTTYKYYVDHDNESSRIKQQIKRRDGAITESTKITDDDIIWFAYNYAGYNNRDSTKNYGGYYQLTSPNTKYDDNDWYVFDDGGFNYYDVFSDAIAVAPAFCI